MLVHFLPICELRRMDDYMKNIIEMVSVVSMMTVSGKWQREVRSMKREALWNFSLTSLFRQGLLNGM